MKRKCVTCDSLREHFRINALTRDLFNVEIFENVREVQASVSEFDEEAENAAPVTQYRYDYYTAVIKASDYGSFIAGIIHLKFSEDDEIALMNKGIADKENAEYVDYRAFVAEIKELAKQYFSNEE